MIILPLKILLVSLLAIVWIPAPAFAQGFLRAEGQRIVNESGEEVLLRGMGLGGWMLQEGYMLRTSGPQYRIEERIEELVGHDRKEEFYDAWLANHMRRIDVDSMAAWGFNSVRPALHYKWFTPPIEEEPVPGDITWHSKGFEMLDDLLDWASANEMYVILDLHAAPGGQGKNADINDYNPEKPSLWESEANQEKTVALWQKLAERYADHPWIGGYDIINEPNWGFQDIEGDPNGCSETENAPLWELSQRITEAIRQVDQNHIVIIEGNCWGNNYRGLPELWDDNLVISFHKYWNYNDVASIQHMLEMREERNVPIWLGETGENSNTWFTDAIELLEAHDIGWAWWPLKKIGINNPLEIRTNPGYERIRAYWRGEDERPTQDEAFRALMQLADDLKLENNVVRRDVIDAMMRQPHTDNVIPFKDHVVSAVSPTRISAVDFDLGRAGFAYNDNHLANYRVSTGGPSTAWNEGRVYRNDGVDIDPGPDPDSPDYSVGWTEAGEWLQYTIRVKDGATYTLQLETAAEDTVGAVSLEVDGEIVAENIPLPATGSQYGWAVTDLADVDLDAGTRRVRLIVHDGGMNIRSLHFIPNTARSFE